VSRRAQWSKDLEALVAKPWRSVQRVHKYRAKRTEVDGIPFASQKEARRYQELKLLEKAGEIRCLELQPRFPLVVPGVGNGGPYERRHLGDYVADFRYADTRKNAIVVEDVKGFKTPLYRWKKKHVEAQYGITIVET
jgi:hypothetical protein